ncbi:hypothetical protein CPC08DRAFT_593403, partial [Agrocybe pediades]
RTHRDEATAAFLAAQDLRIKLDLNREIELANHARTMQTIRHRTNPEQYPEPGSPAASFITIPDDDLNDLRIPALLFTDSVSTLPLPFFEESVLRKIISKASSIPSKKHTALNGKTVHIWDLKWMKAEFKIKEELELTHSEFCQASDNYYRFQATKAEDPAYTERYRVHFTFYRNLDNSAATYDGWKSAELETRSNAAELNHAYSEHQYTNA